MPKLTKSVPTYSKHKASGQAVVKIDGRLFYLGPHGTKASKVAYDQIVMQWLASGRQLPPEHREAITITELCVAYFENCQTYYVRNGKQTGSVDNIRFALRKLRELFPDLYADEFGPLKLKAVRESMIAAGWSRTYVNGSVGHIKRMFRWGASEELVPGSVYQDLHAVAGLKKGRSAARETGRVKPIELEVVNATLPHMLAIPADMVRVQLLTGARPTEICTIRPGDIDRTDDVWVYTPQEHKTDYADKDRRIFIGPEAQEVLRPYLLRAASVHCFSPAEAVEQQRRQKRLERKTPIKYERRKPKAKPRREASDCYDHNSYRRAIHRACDKANPAPVGIEGKSSRLGGRNTAGARIDCAILQLRPSGNNSASRVPR